jgi:hypothetical protein
MSQYQCAQCGSTTNVIDTRPTHRRLRRRRKCPHGHRFSTIEVPIEVAGDLRGLIAFWAKETEQDADFILLLNGRIDEIVLGKPPPDG